MVSVEDHVKFKDFFTVFVLLFLFTFKNYAAEVLLLLDLLVSNSTTTSKHYLVFQYSVFQYDVHNLAKYLTLERVGSKSFTVSKLSFERDWLGRHSSDLDRSQSFPGIERHVGGAYCSLIY